MPVPEEKDKEEEAEEENEKEEDPEVDLEKNKSAETRDRVKQQKFTQMVAAGEVAAWIAREWGSTKKFKNGKRDKQTLIVNSLFDRQGEVDREHRQGGFQEHATCDMSQANKLGEITLATT